MCLVKVDDWEKTFPQTSQPFGFSPVWVRMCLVKLDDWEKTFPQTSQRYGFSSVWVRMCLVKVGDWEKTFPQTSQRYGFSPVWVRMCLVKLDDWEKTFPQTSQLFGFSPVWVRMCVVKVDDWEKLLPHSEHLKSGIQEALLLTLMFRVQIISLFLEITEIGKCKLNYSAFCAVSHIAVATNRRVIASVHWKSQAVYVGAVRLVVRAGVDGLFSALPATRPGASLVHGGLMRLPDPEHPDEAS